MCGFFPLYVNLREKYLKEFTQLIMHCLNFVGTQLIGAYFILKDLKDEPLACIGQRRDINCTCTFQVFWVKLNISQELEVGQV